MMCPEASLPLPGLLRHQSGYNRQIFQVRVPRGNVRGKTNTVLSDICVKSPKGKKLEGFGMQKNVVIGTGTYKIIRGKLIEHQALFN